MIGISRGMSSCTCSYCVRAAHTLHIPLEHDPHVKGAPTGAFGCHPPNEWCLHRKTLNHEEEMIHSDNYALEFHFQSILLLLGWGKNLY